MSLRTVKVITLLSYTVCKGAGIILVSVIPTTCWWSHDKIYTQV